MANFLYYSYGRLTVDQNELFEKILKESQTEKIDRIGDKKLPVLREMATRWRPTDGGGKWPMWIKIGSGVHGDGQAEHGEPHAHFLSKDKEKRGVFSILDEDPPNDYGRLKVIEGDIPTEWKKMIVDWAKEKNLKYKEYTNWDVSRDDWYVNKGDD
jgi:hypothetical protein